MALKPDAELQRIGVLGGLDESLSMKIKPVSHRSMRELMLRLQLEPARA